eukprot:3088010-Rhodomonas_salina.1
MIKADSPQSVASLELHSQMPGRSLPPGFLADLRNFEITLEICMICTAGSRVVQGGTGYVCCQRLDAISLVAAGGPER